MNVASIATRILQPRPPYGFHHALTYFTRRAGELVDRAEAGAYRRLFALPEGNYLAEVRPVADDTVPVGDPAVPGERASDQGGGDQPDQARDQGGTPNQGGSRTAAARAPAAGIRSRQHQVASSAVAGKEQPHSQSPGLARNGSLLLSVTPVDAFASSANTEQAADQIAAMLNRTLGLDDDLTAFRAMVAADPPLAAIVERYAGLRLVSTPAPFEAFVWAVLGQQISLLVAFRLKAALVRRLGVAAELEGSVCYAFPTAEAIAATAPDEMAALGLGRRKAATIVATARAIAEGRLDLDALAALPLDEAEAVLTGLHGVGPWTAHYVLLRGLRRADAIPVSDMGLRVAVGAAYGLGRKAEVAEVAAYAERWRPFRGYAAFYLWYSLTELGRNSDG
ncbi:MAG: DNA-3-methyladenine glycosylase 2 [Dehalococcoidia bacterium]